MEFLSRLNRLISRYLNIIFVVKSTQKSIKNRPNPLRVTGFSFMQRFCFTVLNLPLRWLMERLRLFKDQDQMMPL